LNRNTNPFFFIISMTTFSGTSPIVSLAYADCFLLYTLYILLVEQ
jgi:hypothetical protein